MPLDIKGFKKNLTEIPVDSKPLLAFSFFIESPHIAQSLLTNSDLVKDCFMPDSLILHRSLFSQALLMVQNMSHLVAA